MRIPSHTGTSMIVTDRSTTLLIFTTYVMLKCIDCHGTYCKLLTG